MATTSIEAKDKKVLLFGLFGSGKSTIAKVLVQGRLQPLRSPHSDYFYPAEVYPPHRDYSGEGWTSAIQKKLGREEQDVHIKRGARASASAEGWTSAVQKNSGRGWVVTDTVGLLFTNSGAGVIAHAGAKNKLLDFLEEVKDEYSHIIFVHKAGKFSKVGEVTWNLFAKIFEGAEDAFVIVITAASPEWLEANRHMLPDQWKKHDVLTTDIPPFHFESTGEKQREAIRKKSTAKLENDLEQLFEARGNKYSTPRIATMNEEQLKLKSRSLFVYLVSETVRLFRPLGKNNSNAKEEVWNHSDNKMVGQEVQEEGRIQTEEPAKALPEIFQPGPESIIGVDVQVHEIIVKLNTIDIRSASRLWSAYTPLIDEKTLWSIEEDVWKPKHRKKGGRHTLTGITFIVLVVLDDINRYKPHHARALSDLIELWQTLYNYRVFLSYKDDGKQLFLDLRKPLLLTASTPDESHVLEPIEPLVPRATLPANSDAIGEGQFVGDQEMLENDSGLLAETKMRASGTSFVEVFGREVKEGREDAYFVSSKWLFSLEEQEKTSLMSILRRGGYSETCQTGGTILFARTENQSLRNFREEFVSLENVNAPKAYDDLEIAGKGLNTGKSVSIADVFGSSSNLEEPNSSIDHERTLRRTFSNERRQAVRESFKVALKSSSSYQSFCVSTRWLSSLEDQEKEALTTHVREAGYEKISQNSNGTWYQRIRGREEESYGAYDDIGHSSSSSERNDVAGGKVQESTISKLLGYLALKPKTDGAKNTSGSSRVAPMIDTNEIQDADYNCRAQTLRVACSSSTHQTAGEPLQRGDFYRQEFGDSVGHWPTRESDNISTKLEKSFKIPTLQFLTDERGTEVPTQVLISLKAFAETSLSCCLRVGHHPQKHPQKIRLKFSKISAEVQNKDSEEEEDGEPEEEESCNAMVLSYLCTNVYGSDSGGRQIILHLEDEYNSPPGKRLLADSQLSWLEKSGITPKQCEPGSTSLVLRSDIEKRRRHDSGRAHPLLFQDTRPAVYEGQITSGTHLESFLKFHVRHKLEISYFRPSRPILEEGPVWIANNATREIDFGCCLAIRTESISASLVGTK